MKEYLVIAYGSLLNSEDREKDSIVVKDKSTIKLEGYRFAFDHLSIKRNGGVLNLRKTENPTDYVSVKIYTVDSKSYSNIQDREMGKGRTSPYKEIQVETEFGTASLFIIPNDRVNPTPALDWYVDIVKEGFKQTLKMRSCNIICWC